MNGSELAFAGDVVGVLLAVAGATVLDGVVGVLVDFDGEVPLLGPEPLPDFVGSGALVP